MTPSSLEKVARANWEKRREGWGAAYSLPWERLPDDFRANEIVGARAALQALIPPSEEMVGAGYRELLAQCDGVSEPNPADFARAFTAAIRSILGEG